MTIAPGLIRSDRPAPRRLDALVRLLHAHAAGPTTGLLVSGVAIRSQDVRPGDLFVGLPGAHHHGAAFARAAQLAGAVAILTDGRGAALVEDVDLPVIVVDDPRGRLGEAAAWILRTRSAVPLLLGVTGTDGKTTTVTFIDHLLRALGRRTGLSTTTERSIAGVGVPSRLTTPEADELHGLLAAMREQRVDAAAFEVSAQALVRARVAGIRFDVAGFTNLSHEHLDDFGDMTAYLAAKARLFEASAARRGVVSLDSPDGARLVERAEVPVATIATGARADWRVTVLQQTAEGTRFRLEGPDGGRLTSRVAMLGTHAAANAGLAVAMVCASGVELSAVEAALGDRGFDDPVPGRLEPLAVPHGAVVYLDVAHTPHALATSLAAVRAVTPGRITVVLGADGDRDPTKRFGMGHAVGSLADLVLVTDHHSRFEDPEPIRAALLAGARAAGGAAVREVPDQSAAIRAAIGEAAAGDAVVWAGTGRTEYLDVRGVKRPYSFLAEARSAIAEAHGTAA
jgi:UDP-N-acetylmuramoyl-L-alanyl-D-glutamate--2,6-diaminopimelate ligase